MKCNKFSKEFKAKVTLDVLKRNRQKKWNRASGKVLTHHLTTTANNADDLINDLMKGFSITWGEIK